MTKPEAIDMLAFLASHYPHVQNQGLSPSTERLWVGYFTELPKEEVYTTICALVRKEKWFPSWAEFIDCLQKGDALPAEDAWGIALAGKGLGMKDDKIKKAIIAVGGDWAFRHCDNLAILRTSFINAYQAIVNVGGRKHEELLKASVVQLEGKKPGRLKS